MSGVTDYSENRALNYLTGTVWAALFLSDPGEAGSGTEVSGSGYARVAVTWPAASGGATSNAEDIVFPQAAASWGRVTYVALMDALTGGHVLCSTALPSPGVDIELNDIPVVPASAWTLRAD